MRSSLVAFGFLLQFVFKAERVRSYGNVLLGLGLIFYGMQLMSDGMRPLQLYAPFIDFMKNMDSPLVGILFGALFTGLVQSSSATTGIVIVLASSGLPDARCRNRSDLRREHRDLRDGGAGLARQAP